MHSRPSSVIINLKINNFRLINQQQPKLVAIFFLSKFNPDAHVSTKINTFTFNKGQGGEGGGGKRSQRKL